MKKNYIHWITRLQLVLIAIFISFNTGCQFNKEQAVRTEIHFIDTGNSDAILIKQGDNAALIDGGDNDDEELIAAYIKNQGIKQFEYVFVTHPDADHIGGLDAVIDQFAVNAVYVGNGKADTKTYRDFIEALMNKGLTPSVPLLNSTFKMGNADFKVLSVASAKDVNNTSLVLLYTNGKDKLLFMGDVDKEIERNINVGKVDLIKIGHHGSRSSSDKAFLIQIEPKYAVITVGERNKYGHPHAETMEVLEQLAIPVYRTDEGGNLIFVSTGNGVTTKQLPNSYLSGESKKSKQNVETNKQPQKVVTHTTYAKVFFTKNSKKYHSLLSCSGMKSPQQGTLEDVGDRTACNKCY
ncbi:ComEC/Rec2 family competence protein [Cellulosilyticum sp. I15G10I2]|uniref:ComEC/Rec2 family competence protein n=1 Tax=Cellulosilyticum sp. I15G10I2 TaxID=1892843 RepID=UPI00085C3380|nr:ComEC/Rec2 family competence protein [Cellulosilyticum sp. I15G10I2]